MRKNVLAAVVFLAVLVTATAQAQTWTVVSLDTTGCASGNIGLTTTVSGIASFPTTLRFHTIVDSGGLRYMDEDAGNPGSNGNYGWHLYTSSSGGPTTGSFPIPAGQIITVTLDLINGPGGPAVSHQVFQISQCDGGVLLMPAAPALDPKGLAILAVLLAVGALLVLRQRA